MKPPFTQRFGGKAPRVDIQRESMDSRLRNKLWNTITLYFLNGLMRNQSLPILRSIYSDKLIKIWHHIFCEPVDDIPPSFGGAYQEIRRRFFSYGWDEAYEFIEQMALVYDNQEHAKKFRDACNNILEEEKSAYRFIGDWLTDIISGGEIKEIEGALENNSEPVRQLIGKALEEYADKEKPDYPNSIKDAVSAVESLMKIIADDGSPTLGKALPAAVKKLDLDPTLAASIEKIYGFRNTKEGVGHGSKEPINVSPEEARLCLIVCSAWINFLSVRAQKNNVRISE